MKLPFNFDPLHAVGDPELFHLRARYRLAISHQSKLDDLRAQFP